MGFIRRARGLAAVAALATAAAAATAVLPLAAPASAAGLWTGPDPVDGSNTLTSVSCPDSTFCLAGDTSGNVVTYADGAWTTGSAGAVGGVTSVSCPGAGSCVAVDTNGDALTDDDGTWSSYQYDPYELIPLSVSCPEATFCVAVGNSSVGFTYDDGSWDDGTDIDPDGSNANAVSCTSDTFCVAVDDEGKALIDNSGTWQPTPVDGQHYMTSVSCPTTTFCLAADSSGNVVTDNNGTWTSYPLDAGSALESISCPTTGFCAAVDSHGRAFTYSGGAWSGPAAIDDGHALNSVSCPTALFCVTVDNAGEAFVYTGSVGPGSYRLGGIVPPGHDTPWPDGTTLPIAATVDHDGFPVSTAQAIALAADCDVAVTAAGAASLARQCMTYDRADGMFTYQWRLPAEGSGKVTVTVWLTFPTSTSRSGSITMTPSQPPAGPWWFWPLHGERG